MSSSSSSASAEDIKSIFSNMMLQPHTLVRIKVMDGRVIHGNFGCMDSDLNFILDNAIEYYGDHEIESDFEDEEIVRRNLGTAMIAGQHIIRICVHEGDNVA